jgi:hypothetical protein
MATPSLPRDGHAITDAAALQLYIDPLWKLVMAHWLLVIKERDAYLLAVFEKCDANADGELDVGEFKVPRVMHATALAKMFITVVRY